MGCHFNLRSLAAPSVRAHPIPEDLVRLTLGERSSRMQLIFADAAAWCPGLRKISRDAPPLLQAISAAQSRTAWLCWFEFGLKYHVFGMAAPPRICKRMYASSAWKGLPCWVQKKRPQQSRCFWNLFLVSFLMSSLYRFYICGHLFLVNILILDCVHKIWKTV